MQNRRNAIHALLIASLLGGLVTGRTFFFHIAYVFAILLVGSFLWSWVSVNWIRISRQTYARRAQVGRKFDERFVVVNSGILPKLWLEVRDQSTLPGHDASHIVPTILPRRKYMWEVHTLCIQRGQFTLGPVTINSGDPFGLFQFPRHIKSTSKVIVYPATVPLYDFAAPIGKLSGGEAVRRRTFEVTTNAAGIRDYASGDPMNRIHWKTSARRGKLYVKEFELDPLSDVWMFVDLDRSTLVAPYGNSGATYQIGSTWRLPANTEEYCVTCAASVAEYFIDKKRALGMVSYTPFREIVQPDRGDRQLTRILEILALAKSETNIPLEQMLAVEAPLIGRGNTLVIVTSSPRDTWIAEAQALRRRGLYVVAIMVDASTFGSVPVNFEHLRIKAETAGIHVYPIKLNDDLTAVLSYTPAPQRFGG